MEMSSKSLANGGLNLPVGYRFCPTDQELIIFYLAKKAFGQPLPASVIPEVDVFQTHPSALPGVGDEESIEKGYFLSNKRDYLYGNVNKIAVGSGFWKTSGKDGQILASATNQVIGTKKTLVFHEANASCEATTRWVMHELRLVIPGLHSCPFQTKWAAWAVYRVFKEKKRNPKRKGKGSESDGEVSNMRKVQKIEEIKPTVIDFTEKYGSDEAPPPPSSPSFSEA